MASGVKGRARRVVVSSITNVARPAAAQTSPQKIVCTIVNELRPNSASAVPNFNISRPAHLVQEIDFLAHQHVGRVQHADAKIGISKHRDAA